NDGMRHRLGERGLVAAWHQALHGLSSRSGLAPQRRATVWLSAAVCRHWHGPDWLITFIEISFAHAAADGMRQPQQRWVISGTTPRCLFCITFAGESATSLNESVTSAYSPARAGTPDSGRGREAGSAFSRACPGARASFRPVYATPAGHAEPRPPRGARRSRSRADDPSVRAADRYGGVAGDRDPVELVRKARLRRVAVPRVLNVDEHRAAIGRHGDSRHLASRHALEQTLHLAALGVRHQHLIIEAVRLTVAVGLNEQAAVGIGPEAVRGRERFLRAVRLFRDQENLPLEARADVTALVS